MQKKQKNIESITDKAIKCLNEIASNNSVVGKPIVTDRGTVIPITKVSLGFLTGGGEYGDVKVVKKAESFPISAGSGAIVSIKPSGFLIIGDEIKIVKTNPDIYDSLFEKIESFVGKINEKK